MTFREWIRKRIKKASLTAKNGRLYDTRLKAAEREKTLKNVLVELEMAGLDLNQRFRKQAIRKSGNDNGVPFIKRSEFILEN